MNVILKYFLASLWMKLFILCRGQIQMMMTATQRKKGSGQNPVLLQNILPARSLREVIRNQKSIRRKARKGDINL
jgi:hypothetical protein